jgi:DNA-binding response OmpR family regulator
MAWLLVIADEKDTTGTIAGALRPAGHQVTVAHGGAQAVQMAQKRPPDLVILDIAMPRMEGLKIGKRFRADPKLAGLPILFLTGAGHIERLVHVFEAKSDDFLTKPFDLSELVVRVRALLRRTKPESPTRLTLGRLNLDCRTYELEVDGKTKLLTPMEFELLYYMMSHAGEVISADRLLQEVWEYPPGVGSPDLVRVHIRNLRAKIEPTPSDPVHIKTISRHGYVIHGHEPEELPEEEEEAKEGLIPSLYKTIASSLRDPGRIVVRGAPYHLLSRIAAGLVLIGFWAFIFLAQPARSEELSVLSVTMGKAEVLRTQTRFLWLRDTKRLTVEDNRTALTGGDRITVDEASKAELTFFEGSRVDVWPGTELTIQQVHAGPKTSQAIIEIEILAGETVNRVEAFSSLRRHFNVETPILTASAQGTTFRVEVISKTHTYLAVYQGIIHVSIGQEEVSLQAGEEAYVVAGQPLAIGPQTFRLNGAGRTITTREQAVIVDGEGPSNSTAGVYVNGRKADMVQTDDVGSFGYVFTASEEGAYRLSVAPDQEGEVGDMAEPVTIAYDCTPPPLALFTDPPVSEVSTSPIVLAGQSEVGAKVTVNGREVPVDADGHFSTPWDLSPGLNAARVVATDPAGNSIENAIFVIKK